MTLTSMGYIVIQGVYKVHTGVTYGSYIEGSKIQGPCRGLSANPFATSWVQGEEEVQVVD